MRLRKIHAVVAVSVALVLVARSIEGRRRAQDGFPAEPVGDLAEDRPPTVEQPAADPEVVPEAEQVAVEEPVAVPAELRSEEPPVPASLEVESDTASTGMRRVRRGPLAVAAAVIVLIAVLAGTVVAVTAGAASSPSASHHRASSLHP